MSMTYSIVCDECKVKCWVGQNGIIYRYKYIADFLEEHRGHKLRYLCDDTEIFDYDNFDSYKEYPETEEVIRNSKEILDELIPAISSLISCIEGSANGISSAEGSLMQEVCKVITKTGQFDTVKKILGT